MTTIATIVAMVCGIGGLFLGIWNRIEQARENRTKRHKQAPHFHCLVNYPDNDGWRPLRFTFYNPSDVPFLVEMLETQAEGVELAPVLVSTPSGPGIAPYAGGPPGTTPHKSLSGKKVLVNWSIEAIADHNRSTDHTAFCKLSADEPFSFSIRVTAREISAMRRKFHMQAAATTNRPHP
jgi:hypothetical protein